MKKTSKSLVGGTGGDWGRGVSHRGNTRNQKSKREVPLFKGAVNRLVRRDGGSKGSGGLKELEKLGVFKARGKIGGKVFMKNARRSCGKR